MKTIARNSAFLLSLLTALLLLGCRTNYPNTLAYQNSTKWDREIANMIAGDATNPPPQNGIVFVGSSSIQRWKTLAADFPGFPVINRGFGGSEIADSVHFADRIIIPYHPKQVIIYAGGNDVNAGKDPKLIFGDFVALTKKIHSALPHTRITFISIGPNPARWTQAEKVKEVNRLAEEYCRQHNIDFINVFPLMLGLDGQPKPDIYVADRIHMNPKGYALWIPEVEKYLVR